jgi:hypothetical protein
MNRLLEEPGKIIMGHAMASGSVRRYPEEILDEKYWSAAGSFALNRSIS